MLRSIVLLAALAMPAVAVLSQRGAFGPDVGTVSDRYPTLLVAAGYAFAIWGPIFALDFAFAVWQWRRRRADAVLDAVRGAAAVGYGLTALWMVVFSQRWFWLALAIIWAALAALLFACLQAAAARTSQARSRVPRWSLGLHAGWLSLAAFLNTAQVVVAYELLPVDAMLPWSSVLWLAAAALLLAVNARLRAHPAYPLAALWGLAGAAIGQAGAALPGARVSAAIAVVSALALAAQTLWLRRRGRGGGGRLRRNVANSFFRAPERPSLRKAGGRAGTAPRASRRW